MSYLDFAELKERVSIEQVISMLGLELKRKGDQLRGPCPIHKGENDRGFVVTISKGLFYCFGGCKGGDMITLVARVKGIDTKEAAKLIAEHHGTVPQRNSTSSRRGNSRGNGTVPGFKPLDYLEADHMALRDLEVSGDTLTGWGAGYAPKGIMRGRLAIPIHSKDGTLLAYCGVSLKEEESPRLLFPNGFDPKSVIFGANRVEEGELFLAREPVEVLEAHEHGIATNVVCFLTESITPQQLEQLAALMDEKQCETMILS